MNGGVISGNVGGTGGGLFVGNGEVDLNDSINGRALAVINGGEISGNRSGWLGGGVAVSMAGDLTLNNGTISGNKTVASASAKITGGGGVGIWDYWTGYLDNAYETQTGWTKERLKQFWENTWSQKVPARFTMNGGVIDGNATDGVGGGIYAGSGAVQLKAGTISNNVADNQGGGIYVPAVPYVAHLTRALVTQNTASELGSGIWACPTGDVHVLLNNTGAVFANTSDGAGGDVVSLKRKTDASYELSLSSRMLGGGSATWYDNGGVLRATETDQLGEPDPAVARFSGTAGATPHAGTVADTTRDLALHTETLEAGRAAAVAASTLTITGNKAVRGAGIGTNGSIVLGTEDEAVSVPVRKVWNEHENADEPQPARVQVKLLRDGVWADTAELSAENGWAYTFEGLPKHVDGDLGTESVYTVEEVAPAGYTSEISGNAADGFTVTNTPVVSTRDIAVTKVWDDADNQDETRPSSVTVHLLANGVDTGKTLELNAENSWKGSFKDLPVKKDGAEIAYTVVEDEVGGYTAEVSGTAADGFTITNRHEPTSKTPDKPETEKPAKSNPRTPRGVLPKTGDMTLAFTAAGALGGAGLLGVALRRRRRG